MQSGSFSFGNFVWWMGVVENRNDKEKKNGRVQVRIFGYHNGDPGAVPTDQLPWAIVMQGITDSANSGLGNSPTGIVEGTTVFGFFADGNNAQTPVVMGTIPGFPNAEKFEGGFVDPSGNYPRVKGENDVNRLARNERIGDTIVQKKRDGIDTADVAFGGTWREPSTRYGAEYPYNHVRETESGHVVEYDDTPGKERISQWHKKGTFTEIDPDGSKVEKIVKDNYEIIHGDDSIYIKGSARVTIDGNSSVFVKGNANIEVGGNMREHVHGNYTLNVDGNYTVTVNGTHRDHSATHRRVTAPRIDLN